MRSDGQTIRGNELDTGRVRDWIRRTFSRERMTVAAARLVVAGYVGFALAQIFQAY